MEFQENVTTPKKKPFLCLNMIVKNEAHIIVAQLQKLLKKVPEIDYWVISDTGSTDNTASLIENFFHAQGIEGEMHHDEWKDFGHNRSLALKYAYTKSRYLLVFDADDEIVGDFKLPIISINGEPSLPYDRYFFAFGNASGTAYLRVQLVNNMKRWKYIGVLHEWIECEEPCTEIGTITGNYYTISGRSGNRSKDPQKYLKDALILEKAHAKAVEEKDGLYIRYAFYCANSFYDYGQNEDAIKWYKITLEQPNWSQEKYVSCLHLFESYKRLNQTEIGIYYLVKSFAYDTERVECLYELVVYYFSKQMYDVAFNYYKLSQDYYEKQYLHIDSMGHKLFLSVDRQNFYFPYYMILLADKVKQPSVILHMFKIIFAKKAVVLDKFYVGNFLYNIQFFIDKFDAEAHSLCKEYIDFLLSYKYPVFDHDFMFKYEKYGIKPPAVIKLFSKEDCLNSRKVLFYTGFCHDRWNSSHMQTHAIGGSESAVAHLAKQFPKNYDIYIVGDVIEETYDGNVHYVSNEYASIHLIESEAFHTVIVSRYVCFFTRFPKYCAYQTFLWAHDTEMLIYNSHLSSKEILSKYSSHIAGCICQTEWHKNLFENLYPMLQGKLYAINNGIQSHLFVPEANDLVTSIKRVQNRFLYSSRSERGLNILISLWKEIQCRLNGAQLFICSYNPFPKNAEDKKMKEMIDQSEGSIVHLGRLSQKELYDFMRTVDYWLYTNTFMETSCITALEMMASGVVCLYYPNGGLVNTIGEYGIQVKAGNEVDKLSFLNDNEAEKDRIRQRSTEYALGCSWRNRAKLWEQLLNLEQVPTTMSLTNTNNIKVIDCFLFYNEIDLLNYRLHLLNEVVDYFVIVESTHTFVGKDKPLFFQENKHLFETFMNKIVHIIVDDFPYKQGIINNIGHQDVWKNEFFQRNAISRGIDKLNTEQVLMEKDILVIADLDEIPDPNTLRKIKTREMKVDFHGLEMDLYYYTLNNRMNEKWYKTKLISYKTYQALGKSCEEIRGTSCQHIAHGGWHLSYFGDKYFIQNKIANFSHQELNKSEFTDLDKIEERKRNNKDLYDRNINITKIQVQQNTYLPPEYEHYLNKYYE